MKRVMLNQHSLETAKLAPREESRYTLKAICVTEQATVVTNGHYLVHVTHPKQDLACYPSVPGAASDAELADVKQILVGRDSALELLKAMPKKEKIPILNNAVIGQAEDGSIKAVTTDLDMHRPATFRKVDGQYPNWQAVITSHSEPMVRVGLNAAYVAELLKQAASYNERSNFVEISIWNSQQAVRFDAYDPETNQNWTAMLMPMRGTVDNRPFPYPKAEAIPDPFKDVPEFAPSADLAECS